MHLQLCFLLDTKVLHIQVCNEEDFVYGYVEHVHLLRHKGNS
jgi:hypothetical protein